MASPNVTHQEENAIRDFHHVIKSGILLSYKYLLRLGRT